MFDLDDGVIVIGDGDISVDGVKVSASRVWIRDPRHHHPTAAMIEAEFRQSVKTCLIVPIEPGMKWCYVCGRIKTLLEFPPRRTSRDGRDARCHECEAERQRQTYAEQAAAAGREVRAYRRRVTA